MSNSWRVSFKEDKFNLKLICYLFILLDIFLVPIAFEHAPFRIHYFYFICFELGLILSLAWGLRGQGRFRIIMNNLESIARNKDISTDEREHRLVMSVHHHFLELGYLYQERNVEYGFDFKKKRKISKEVKDQK